MKVAMRLSALFAVGILVTLASMPTAEAYPQYSQNGNTNSYCRACHGDFRAGNYTSKVDGLNWGNLHNLHRQTMLSGDCNTCHGNSTFPVQIGVSNGGNGLVAIACSGCHGRAEDDVPANPATPGMSGAGAGLRQHHHVKGVTVCLNCHADADPAAYTPVGENVLPPYYANPGQNHPNMPTSSCNPGPAFVENFAGETRALDNDGNNLFDALDPACSVCGDGVVNGNEACDTSGESATCNADCTLASCGDGKLNATAGEDCDDAGESATCDADCSLAACDDGTLNVTAGETCDPIASCPTSCDDGDACTTDALTGSAANCDAACDHTTQSACVNGDGCCPAGCDDASDDDCPAGGGGGGAGPGGAAPGGAGGAGGAGNSGNTGGTGNSGNTGGTGNAAAPEESGGCSCKVGPSGSALGAGFAAALLGLAALGRRRKRGQGLARRSRPAR